MQPFELEPAVDTLEDVAALLRKRGNVLVDEGAFPSSSRLMKQQTSFAALKSANVSINAGDTGEKLLVALLGDYGYALYLDGRASSMLPADFATAHPEVRYYGRPFFMGF